jgi:hypothetical protein
VSLPLFPLDDATLDLLERSLDPWSHGDPGAASSSLEPFLEMMSQLGGSDPAAAESEDDGVVVLRDAQYSAHDLILALVAEVRRLRAES